MKELYETLHSNGKADPRKVGSAQVLHQAVVPSSASYGILGSQAVCDHFERGPHVIIQPPHHSRVDHKGRIEVFQIGLDAFEMLCALAANGFQEHGSARKQLLAAFHLAVEGPERVRVPPPLTVGTECIGISSR